MIGRRLALAGSTSSYQNWIYRPFATGARRATVAAIMAVALTGTGLAFSAPAKAAVGPLTAVFGHVNNGASVRCLDSGAPTDTLLFRCSASPYQQWEWDLNTLQIKGHDPAGCLDGGAGLNGTLVPMVPCNSSLTQVWYYGIANSTWVIVNAASGRCLDADLATINQQGTTVQVWDCGGGANQKWYFQYIIRR